MTLRNSVVAMIQEEKLSGRIGSVRTAEEVVGNDRSRDNRERWRSISGFDESAERPISRRSTIKKERRLARALKIFKIVCQAELQPRSGPRNPLPPASQVISL